MNLEINNLSKKYSKEVWGLRDFSLNVSAGVLGLLGPNGAGKSTLMKILATVTRPTGGGVSWNGIDLVASPEGIRSVLGYLPQDFGIYPNLNAIEFLTYLAAARGISGKQARIRIDRLLELVNLVDARKRRLGTLSGGMKQRLGIAQALLNDPMLLIVDEPTAGLDPEERIRFRNLLSELSGERVVILSSHIVSDIEAVASSIAIMNRGRLLIHNTPQELLQLVNEKVWEVETSDAAMDQLRSKYVVGSTIRNGKGVRVRVIGDERPGGEAIAAVPTLEDAYLFLLSQEQDRGPRE